MKVLPQCETSGANLLADIGRVGWTVPEDTRRLTRLSCIVGVFSTYRIQWNDNDTKMPVGNEDSSVRHLDAFLADEKTAMNSLIMRE